MRRLEPNWHAPIQVGRVAWGLLRILGTRWELDLDRRIEIFGATFGLSEREQQTIRLLAGGTHPKEIGAHIGCAYSSVRTHLRRAAKKLSCSGTREIVIRFFSDVPTALP